MANQRRPPEPRSELGKAWQALKEGELEACFSAACGFLTAEDMALRREANKLCGITLFRQNRYPDAVPYFAAAAELSSEVNDWFNLVTSSTLAGDIIRGQAAFQRAWQFQEQAGWSQHPTAPFMRYYYAQALRDVGEPRLALAQFEELRKLYEKLRITDDTFVYIRGMPFLLHTLRAAVPVFRALAHEFDARAWLGAFASNVDDDGKRDIADIVAELANDA
jgi:tetratricopeptide (TPR) repeat protein